MARLIGPPPGSPIESQNINSHQLMNMAKEQIPAQEIQLRQICHFFRADPAYGIGVAQALGMDLAEFMPNGAVQLETVAEK